MLDQFAAHVQCAIALIALGAGWVNTDTNDIGGANDGRHSTRAQPRSTLTFWPLLQQFSHM
ncbi:MAG: hypothetical protein CBD47_03510 [Synechococcus sp. TMED187]|jgi:hypothetical protein|nr:hypothetical protein [Synechococcus sp. NAT40]OUW48092.1 MAG: hypothetical protein CBD47_03510 [Synechococcus sp. TMED187]